MELLIIFIAAAAAGVLLTWVAMKLNIIDTPNYRKIHSSPVPKAGGIGFVLPVLFIMIWRTATGDKVLSEITFILITLLLLLVGIIDDKFELSARKKLLFQVLAAVTTVSSGTAFHLCDYDLINYFVSVIWIVGFINAMNLIDGLDGLAGGIGFIAAAGILLFAMVYSDKMVSIIAIALMGGLIGFLFWNRHPAKIFMGDTGSLSLGYLLAVLIMNTGNMIGGFGGAAISFFIAAIPVYDTLLSIVRRKLNHRPIFSPDRSHFYNLLMDRKGLSHKRTVYLIYAFCVLLLLLAFLLDRIQPAYRYIFAFIIIIIAVLGSVKAGFLKVDDKRVGD